MKVRILVLTHYTKIFLKRYPILINNWEATCFGLSERENLLELDKAKKATTEPLWLDDGEVW